MPAGQKGVQKFLKKITIPEYTPKDFKKFREEVDLSQSEIAPLFGVDGKTRTSARNSFSKIERGEGANVLSRRVILDMLLFLKEKDLLKEYLGKVSEDERTNHHIIE